jgi:hypothetical protein
MAEPEGRTFSVTTSAREAIMEKWPDDHSISSPRTAAFPATTSHTPCYRCLVFWPLHGHRPSTSRSAEGRDMTDIRCSVLAGQAVSAAHCHVRLPPRVAARESWRPPEDLRAAVMKIWPVSAYALAILLSTTAIVAFLLVWWWLGQ